MNRKFVRRCISLITVFGILLMLMLQAAATNDAVESTPQRFDPAVYEVQLRVTTENCESVISKYDVPDEVADRIRELCQEFGVTELLVPGDSAPVTYSTSTSWSPVRNYKGYKLKDWVVTVNNCFAMTSITSNGSAAANFAATVLAYCAGVVIDRFVPFGSSGITLIQYACGSNSSYYAGTGDKAQAAPQFLTYETFTYRVTDQGNVLGARTYYSYLKTISWFYYNSKTDTPKTRTQTYNISFQSPHYSNVNEVAISSATSAVMDEPINLKIGQAWFVLK